LSTDEGKVQARRQKVEQILVRTYHARLRGSLPPRGAVQMADAPTEAELSTLDIAPRGPGVDPIIESQSSGSYGRTLRWRNSGEHPLTLAYERGQITANHFAAGENLRVLVETLYRSSKDSTDIERISGGGSSTPWSQRQADAVRQLAQIEKRLRKADWIICRKFCGEGYKMLEAVRAANISFNKFRVVSRVCVALDYLAGNRKKHAHKPHRSRKPAATI
jgi:hypothetical protein